MKMKKEKEYIVKVLECGYVTHNVRYFIVEKPKGFKFIPGQATDLSINKPNLKNEIRNFTFTTLPDNPFLEFTIKMYKEKEGFTKHLKDIKEGDEFIIRKPFGAIHYKGKGVFIAGGAGITPFIAILRNLRKENKLGGNKLIFSNRTSKDIILEHELQAMLGENCILTLTREKNKNYDNRRIDENYLKEKIKDFNQHFYICGPIRMVGEIQSILRKLGADAESVVVET